MRILEKELTVDEAGRVVVTFTNLPTSECSSFWWSPDELYILIGKLNTDKVYLKNIFSQNMGEAQRLLYILKNGMASLPDKPKYKIWSSSNLSWDELCTAPRERHFLPYIDLLNVGGKWIDVQKSLETKQTIYES